jgi:hypothetical protein
MFFAQLARQLISVNLPLLKPAEVRAKIGDGSDSEPDDGSDK